MLRTCLSTALALGLTFGCSDGTAVIGSDAHAGDVAASDLVAPADVADASGSDEDIPEAEEDGADASDVREAEDVAADASDVEEPDPMAAFWALDGCPDGEVSCIDVVIKALQANYDSLAPSCDHDALFALAYLRTTESIRTVVGDDQFFADPAHINHQDVVFAAYYLRAFDAWHEGRKDEVPEAWRLAFEQAENGTVNAAGNIAFGTNAHVQRDLPFVLEEIHSVQMAAKADHDKANEILQPVYAPLIAEAAALFDPVIAELPPVPYELLAGWREQAWLHAVALVEAPDLESRAKVAAEIETYAVDQVALVRVLTAGDGNEARDLWCKTQGAGVPK